MASRFHQRDSRNALFSNYDANSRSRPSSSASRSPARSGPASQNVPYSSNPTSSPYGYSGGSGVSANDSSTHLSVYPPSNGGFSAYPGAGGSNGDAGGRGSMDGGFRPATPNKRGQYSDAVLSELESQNDDQSTEMSKKVKMLKDLTMAIGDEIRDSTAFAEKMNESFEGTRNRLRGTMNRMLRMAERTGVGWRIWLGFFLFIFLLFAYVWLF